MLQITLKKPKHNFRDIILLLHEKNEVVTMKLRALGAVLCLFPLPTAAQATRMSLVFNDITGDGKGGFFYRDALGNLLATPDPTGRSSKLVVAANSLPTGFSML